MGNLFVKLTDPDNGYNQNKKDVEELSTCIFYKVDNLEIGQSSTCFKIKEYPNKSFNSVQFTFFELSDKGKMVECDIYSSTEYNPYLQKRF